MGTWWLAASSQQHACSCITSREVFGKTSNHPGDSDPLKPRLVSCDFWIFLKLKSPLKGKRFHTINKIQEKMTGQLMAILMKDFAEGFEQWKRWCENCEVPRCLVWRIEVSLSYVQYFLYLLSSSINVSIFHIKWLDTFWTDLEIYIYI